VNGPHSDLRKGRRSVDRRPQDTESGNDSPALAGEIRVDGNRDVLQMSFLMTCVGWASDSNQSQH
jgi:hypothetical protein